MRIARACVQIPKQMFLDLYIRVLTWKARDDNKLHVKFEVLHDFVEAAIDTICHSCSVAFLPLTTAMIALSLPCHSPSLQRTIETKRYNLESAEGCYSMALMYSKDIKAKYAVKVRVACAAARTSEESITAVVLPSATPRRVPTLAALPRAVATAVHGVYSHDELANPCQLLWRAGFHRHVRGPTWGQRRGGDHRGCACQALPAARPEKRRRDRTGLRRKDAGANCNTSIFVTCVRVLCLLTASCVNSAKFVSTLARAED